MFRVMVVLVCGLLVVLARGQSGVVSGRVVGPEGPVPFASTLIKGTTIGMATDGNGHFTLKGVPTGRQVLLISVVGYVPVERTVHVRSGEEVGTGDIRVERSTADLEEVVITGTLREVSRSESPVPIEVVSTKLFRKNTSPVLFDAVSMINGVRSQLNCSVCNTGDIHINGMEGPYTLVLIDGMPLVSSLGTVYGLSGIPTGLVERVEVVKGPGGALYGSEAMGGIINVVTRKPFNAPRFTAEGFVTGWNEQHLDLGGTVGLGKARMLLGVNGFRYQDPCDDNGDGFTDLTLQERLSVFGKVDWQRPEGRLAGIGARHLVEDRWGGQLDWTPEFAGGDSIYGETIRTQRTEVFGTWQLPWRERVIAQVSFTDHFQDSWYGTTRYTGEQRIAFGQLYWDRKLGAQHELLAGTALRHTWYDDNTPGTAGVNGTNAPEETPLPGVFVQDEWRFAPAQTLLLGYRLDHHPVHGAVHSPRLGWRWQLAERQTLRFNAGTGFRVVNLFTEDHAALTGSREVVIAEDLLPERSVGGALTYTRTWSSDRLFALVDLTAWHTRFSNQIIGDYETDDDRIIYANLDGFAVSQGLSLNTELVLGGPWKLLAGASWMDVFREEQDPETGRMERFQQLHAPEWSGTFAFSYRPNTWTVDLTGQWYGPMRLPVLENDPRPEYSPWYALLNLQVTRGLGHGLEVFAGVKNLLDFVPEHVLLRPHDPFDQQVDDPADNPLGLSFDAGYAYAPQQGVRSFAGLRWTLE